MKHAHKHLIVAGLLATLGLVAGAQTPAPATGAHPAPTVPHESHGRADPAKMQERMAKHLAAFKQKLQLSPAQEGAWNSYTAALKPTPRQRPDRAEFAKLTTPERIDRMRVHRVARMAEMDKRGDATKTFYAVLTAEQRKVFDEATLRRGHEGRGAHHHGHHQG
jgi:periplasmic protein CpxP/Spy